MANPILALVGGTLIDGTGAPPLHNSVVLVEGGRISKVGRVEDVKVPRDAEVLDLTGKTVLPGFIDSHTHFLKMGVALRSMLDLSGARSLSQALELVEERVGLLEPGRWLVGYGWDESKWPEGRYLDKNDLDPLTPRNPVMLVRVCGHLATVNTPALEAAGITGETEPPEGGQVDRDEGGEPTGILRDCRQLVEAHIPPPTPEELVAGIGEASRLALSLGCTAIHDAGLGLQEAQAYLTAEEQGLLRVRAHLMWRVERPQEALELARLVASSKGLITSGPVKLLMDGSLGAHTAALFEPYEDDPDNRGLMLMEPLELARRIKEAHQAGLQTATHAIGDLAVERVLDSIQEALKAQPRRGHRHRIEHCELTSAQQIERINRLGVVPAMQPNFIGEWSGPGSMYRQRLGPRRERMSNQYRAMLDEGIRVAFGSDCMPFNPLYGVWSAVNHPIKPSRVSLEEAVMCYTLNSAYAAFTEDRLGSVEPGKLADIAVVDRDLTQVPAAEIREAKVVYTILGGEIAYSA